MTNKAEGWFECDECGEQWEDIGEGFICPECGSTSVSEVIDEEEDDGED